MAKVIIDKEACIGCGACTTVSDNFVLEGNKAIVKKSTVSGAELKKAREAVSICPVSAIKVVD